MNDQTPIKISYFPFSKHKFEYVWRQVIRFLAEDVDTSLKVKLTDMPSILFVCTANRFRSPLAEFVFRFELEKSDHAGTWLVGSAGTWTEDGLPPMQDAIRSAAVIGLDLTTHKSRLINAKLMQEPTLILVMDTGHKEALCMEFPDFMGKIYLLSEAAGKVPYNIPDPYVTGEPPGEIAREVIDLIQTGWIKICQLAELCESGSHAD